MRLTVENEFDAFVLRILPIATGVGLIASTFFKPNPSAPVPPEAINGVYESACCESFAIKNGVLLAGLGRARFSLDRDNVSPFVLPDEAVSVEDGSRVVIGGRRLALKLRLKGGSQLNAIEVPDAENGTSYTFVRR